MQSMRAMDRVGCGGRRDGAGRVRSVGRGSQFADVQPGAVKFRFSDERIRAVQELLRRLGQTVPK